MRAALVVMTDACASRRLRALRRVMIHLGFALAFCLLWATGGKILEALLALIFKPELLRQAMNAAGGHVMSKLAENVAGWILVTLPFGVVVYGTVAGMA